MKKLLYILIVLLVACSGNKAYPPATDSFSAVRGFLDGCLRGDFKKADFYMLHNPTNEDLLKNAEKDYKARTKLEKNKLKEASILVNSIEDVSTTVSIVNYRHSYNNVAQKVKVVFVDNKWQVDFSYTFNGNL